MFDPKTQQMLQEQIQGQSPMDASSVMVGGPGIEIAPEGRSATDMPQQTLSKSLFEPQKELEPQAKLMEALKKLNVDPQGINLTKLGKFNLVSKLQKRHGESYAQMTGVRDVLSMFDKYLDSQDGRVAEAKQESIAERTLAALGRR